jgi:DNA-dependent RNA polymerase auxiliary subunit epsilon
MKEELKLLVISLMMVILESDSPETVDKYFWDSVRRVHFVQELEDKITAYIGESEEIDLAELSKQLGLLIWGI